MTPTQGPVPGNREPQMQEAIEETRKTITGADPMVDPGLPVGPNDGPTITTGTEKGAPGASGANGAVGTPVPTSKR